MAQYEVSNAEDQTKETHGSFNMVNICNTGIHMAIVSVEHSLCLSVHSMIYSVFIIRILTG